MKKEDEEMFEAIADLIVKMFTVRQKYQQMVKEMSQTVEAIQANDRSLAGDKGQVFFDAADKMRDGGEDGDDLLKVTNIGLTAQVVAMKDFLAELDGMLEQVPRMMK